MRPSAEEGEKDLLVYTEWKARMLADNVAKKDQQLAMLLSKAAKEL